MTEMSFIYEVCFLVDPMSSSSWEASCVFNTLEMFLEIGVVRKMVFMTIFLNSSFPHADDHHKLSSY